MQRKQDEGEERFQLPLRVIVTVLSVTLQRSGLLTRHSLAQRDTHSPLLPLLSPLSVPTGTVASRASRVQDPLIEIKGMPLTQRRHGGARRLRVAAYRHCSSDKDEKKFKANICSFYTFKASNKDLLYAFSFNVL